MDKFVSTSDYDFLSDASQRYNREVSRWVNKNYKKDFKQFAVQNTINDTYDDVMHFATPSHGVYSFNLDSHARMAIHAFYERYLDTQDKLTYQHVLKTAIAMLVLHAQKTVFDKLCSLLITPHTNDIPVSSFMYQITDGPGVNIRQYMFDVCMYLLEHNEFDRIMSVLQPYLKLSQQGKNLCLTLDECYNNENADHIDLKPIYKNLLSDFFTYEQASDETKALVFLELLFIDKGRNIIPYIYLTWIVDIPYFWPTLALSVNPQHTLKIQVQDKLFYTFDQFHDTSHFFKNCLRVCQSPDACNQIVEDPDIAWRNFKNSRSFKSATKQIDYSVTTLKDEASSYFLTMRSRSLLDMIAIVVEHYTNQLMKKFVKLYNANIIDADHKLTLDEVAYDIAKHCFLEQNSLSTVMYTYGASHIVPWDPSFAINDEYFNISRYLTDDELQLKNKDEIINIVKQSIYNYCESQVLCFFNTVSSSLCDHLNNYIFLQECKINFDRALGAIESQCGSLIYVHIIVELQKLSVKDIRYLYADITQFTKNATQELQNNLAELQKETDKLSSDLLDMQQQNAILQQKLAQLTQQHDEHSNKKLQKVQTANLNLEKKNEHLQENLNKAYNTIKQLKQQQEDMFNQLTQPEPEQTDNAQIDLSIYQSNILLVHERLEYWPALYHDFTNLTVINTPNMKISGNLKPDVIILAISFLSHALYHKILNWAHEKNIPIVYYNGTSYTGFINSVAHYFSESDSSSES